MALKIYFAGSIRGGREDKEIYFELIRHLSKYGTVLTEHVGRKDLDASGEEGISEQGIYERDLSWIQESDVLVAEVSTPSLGVGYEIGKAEGMKKRILCLYRLQEGKKLSAMVSGNPLLKTKTYFSLEEAKRRIDSFFLGAN